ncbi:MAG: hypothetical protein NZ932_04275 [Candidatus Bathyarchaeota archaeon]|nr:hypothetical protein [Candidatus Bathyarchaeota archaeon]MDW8040472.1 hypothetical protein [Nitrososphaerota archaeon]
MIHILRYLSTFAKTPSITFANPARRQKHLKEKALLILLIAMEEAFRNFKTKYERFLKGHEDPSALRREAEKLLVEAKAKGNLDIAEELKEILIELTISSEGMKCNCHMSSRCPC